MIDGYWWHNTAWYIIFLIAVFLFAFIGAITKLAFPKIDRKKEREKSKELAHWISERGHYVTKVREWPTSIVIGIRSDDEEMLESTLLFSRSHPDAMSLEDWIKNNRFINFSFSEVVVDPKQRQDASAYLRLKKKY